MQHILSGQVRYFREWAALETTLRNMVSTLVSKGVTESNDQPIFGTTRSDIPSLYTWNFTLHNGSRIPDSFQARYVLIVADGSVSLAGSLGVILGLHQGAEDPARWEPAWWSTRIPYGQGRRHPDWARLGRKAGVEE